MKYYIYLPRLTRENLNDVPSVNARVDWCSENVGVRDKDWTVDTFSTLNESIYSFKKESDLLIFTLRWS